MKPKQAIFRLAAVAAALLFLAACDTGNPATPTPVAPANTPLVSTPEAGAPSITLEVTGGIAGIRRSMEIAEDGKVRLTDGGSQAEPYQLDKMERGRLYQLFQDADFFNLQERYSSGNVADDIYHTITYSRGGQTRTVTVAQVGGADLTPPALRSIVDKLTEIEEKVRSGTR